MLDKLKSMIESIDNKPFSQYFEEYVMKVQDENIINELSFLTDMNDLTPMRLCRLTSVSIERLVSQFDRNNENSQRL